jgi:hypothetical protein
MGEQRNKITRFADLEVWRRSHELILTLMKDLESLPPSRQEASSLTSDLLVLSEQILPKDSIGAEQST